MPPPSPKQKPDKSKLQDSSGGKGSAVAIAVAAFAFATCGLVFTGLPFNGVGGFMAIASEIKDNICQKYHEDMMKEVLASQAKEAEEKLAESAVHNASEEEPK